MNLTWQQQVPASESESETANGYGYGCGYCGEEEENDCVHAHVHVHVHDAQASGLWQNRFHPCGCGYGCCGDVYAGTGTETQTATNGGATTDGANASASLNGYANGGAKNGDRPCPVCKHDELLLLFIFIGSQWEPLSPRKASHVDRSIRYHSAFAKHTPYPSDGQILQCFFIMDDEWFEAFPFSFEKKDLPFTRATLDDIRKSDFTSLAHQVFQILMVGKRPARNRATQKKKEGGKEGGRI